MFDASKATDQTARDFMLDNYLKSWEYNPPNLEHDAVLPAVKIKMSFHCHTMELPEELINQAQVNVGSSERWLIGDLEMCEKIYMNWQNQVFTIQVE